MRLSPDIAETARNIEGRLLRRLANIKGVEVSARLGVDASTVSRCTSDESITRMAALIAALDMTVVDDSGHAGVVTVTSAKLDAIKLLAREACE